MSQKENSMIWVSFRKEGIHAYPAALTEPELEDVKFLGHPHRHMFHFKVWIQVFHDDRDIEFILWCEKNKRFSEIILDTEFMYWPKLETKQEGIEMFNLLKEIQK